ncbi:xanthine dehydrogenase [Clostridium butyricum]|uniref:xanthine dehydrogenase n=1 Tax=Clostridium butyricum TaxID=1492 RepID=UPI002ABDDF75|nr:xanthine dehydrogenase [Clostridium butyricum]
MKKNDFKRTEYYLYQYRELSALIECIEIQINDIENDVNIAGVSYEEKSAPTNKFNSSVENDVIKRETYLPDVISKLKSKKQKYASLKKRIEIGLNQLVEEERKVVELRYFPKKKPTWVSIGLDLGFDKDHCQRIKNSAINNLSKYIC